MKAINQKATLLIKVIVGVIFLGIFGLNVFVSVNNENSLPSDISLDILAARADDITDEFDDTGAGKTPCYTFDDFTCPGFEPGTYRDCYFSRKYGPPYSCKPTKCVSHWDIPTPNERHCVQPSK